jgi:hypothetical protein
LPFKVEGPYYKRALLATRKVITCKGASTLNEREAPLYVYVRCNYKRSLKVVIAIIKALLKK